MATYDELVSLEPRLRRWDQSPRMLPWFDRADAAAEVDRMLAARTIDAQQAGWLAQWVADGYFVVEGLVPHRLIDPYNAEIDSVWEKEAPFDGLFVSDVGLGEEKVTHMPHADLLALPLAERRELRRVSNWRIGQYHDFNEDARRLACFEPLLAISRLIFQRPARANYSLLFSKGTEQAVHQDTCVFHIFPRDYMLGAWIACEDITPTSGPLEYYPGSHRIPLFEQFDNYPQTNLRTCDEATAAAYHAYLAEACAPYDRKHLLVKKGDVMFWHPMLVHGGSPREDRLATRRSMVLHVMAEGADVGKRVLGPFNW